jgi:diaminopimelate decarboxylase
MSSYGDYFAYQDGVLASEGVLLDQLAEKVGTPAYVYSAEAMLEPLRALQSGLRELTPLICFAVKSCSNIAVLRLLGEAGAGMDIVSGGELHRAIVAGVPPNRIVFSGVGKTDAEITSALGLAHGEQGLRSFNVESVPELKRLSEISKQMGVRAKVALRFNPDVDPKTHPYISTGLKKNKFGMNRKEVLEVARHFKDFPSIDLHGLSIHIGSQLESLSPFGDAFARTKAIAEELASILPAPLRAIDLGGGLGVGYRAKQKTPTVAAYCALVLKHFLPKKPADRRYEILLEPGRIISGSSGLLLTRVLYRKARAAKDFIIVDAAMNDLLRPALYGSYHEISPVKKTRGKARKVDLVGPVCESADCFATDRILPSGVSAGDLLAVMTAGAYGFSMASNYNSRPRPPEVLVHRGQFRVIRERENFADLTRGEHL